MMSSTEKLGYLMVIGITVWQVSLTDSKRMMKSYVWFGPNKGPALEKEADQARRLLYGMAAAGTVGIVLRREKKT